ncbi:hypothetical protein Mapa_008076 [Marchantia paleacea]|nr:hypothetical protein Mapa_008076 [Marchantia paleacea]
MVLTFTPDTPERHKDDDAIDIATAILQFLENTTDSFKIQRAIREGLGFPRGTLECNFAAAAAALPCGSEMGFNRRRRWSRSVRRKKLDFVASG